MKLDQQFTPANLVLNGFAFISGSYGLYLTTHTRNVPFGYLSLYEGKKLLARCSGIGASAAIAIGGVWGIVTGNNILTSKMGLAMFATTFALPFSLVSTFKLNSTRQRSDSDDDAFMFGLSAANSISTGTAVCLASSSDTAKSNVSISTLAASATFPAALSFFMYRSKAENKALLTKAVAATAVVAGVASLAFRHRSG